MILQMHQQKDLDSTLRVCKITLTTNNQPVEPGVIIQNLSSLQTMLFTMVLSLQ